MRETGRCVTVCSLMIPSAAPLLRSTPLLLEQHGRVDNVDRESGDESLVIGVLDVMLDVGDRRESL